MAPTMTIAVPNRACANSIRGNIRGAVIQAETAIAANTMATIRGRTRRQ